MNGHVLVISQAMTINDHLMTTHDYYLTIHDNLMVKVRKKTVIRC